MHHTRLQRARASLEGLALGDAFGEQFFRSASTVQTMVATRLPPKAPWICTDDTVMALSIVDVLAKRGSIDQDRLASMFAARYCADPARGYGGGARRILTDVAAGVHWRVVSRMAFGGRGSMGNGGAMRAAPIGAFFADDPGAAADQAGRSAEVTHAHLEGQAGAMAVAVAAACVAASVREPRAIFDAVLELTPASETWDGIETAATLAADTSVDVAVAALGNGERVVSQDTVPFCLWCAAWHVGRYEDALWTAAAGLGDRDTTCAIVGGILASDPAVALPEAWLAAREPFESIAAARDLSWLSAADGR
jgi:ADP-ribosylglycohydrolase